MSPTRRRTAGSFRSLSRFAAIHNALRRTRRRHRHLRRQRKLHTPAKIRSGSKASSTETNGATCEQGEGVQNMRQELGLEELPEDIFHHIHSLMPIQDAARAARLRVPWISALLETLFQPHTQ
ncbi:uncharacterized protein [Triticum aestivum]|uniref:uncharacterized protein n=1 Tax=Triticum aestivum TaxID=4565 RepID=UPI001D004B7D|nr:uncharacterized protein LOC123175714 [Triticum aestivum]